MFVRCHARIIALAVATLAGLLVMSCFAMPLKAQGKPFPFEHEMHLEADPVRGSRRVPGLLISSNGEVEIDLWCVSGTGRATITGSSITIVPTGMRDNQCPQERLLMDKELLDKLTQVTSWRWDGRMLVLVGPQPLRYRPASN